MRRPPWQYLVFAPLTIFGQLLVVWASGSPIQPSPGGLACFALLLFGLARRWALAWTLLVAWNALMLVLVSGAAFAGARPTVVLAIVLHAASLALLLSPGIRRHVGFGPAPPMRPA
jgi:hypothetical protein